MKRLVILPFLLLASLFMAFYVMDVQAQSPAKKPAPTKAPAKQAAAPGTLAAPGCSGFNGTMKATNWPGGKLTLTCPGKNRMRGKCVGASKQLSPGEKFSFNNCNCLDPKTKCLTVSNLPPGCKVKSKLACASNREVVDGSFQVECGPSPSPCASGAPSEVLPSGDVSPEIEPSFVCLILGADGECAVPSGTQDTTAAPNPCVSEPATNGSGTNTGGSTDNTGGSGTNTGGSDGTFPSAGFPSSDSTFVPSIFTPSDAAPNDGFGQTP